MVTRKGVVFSPGRVNLMGEHVDYNQGIVLPAAIDRKVTLQFSARNDNLISLHAADLESDCVLAIDRIEHKIDISGQPIPSWALYPAGVLWSLMKRGFRVQGFNASYSSDIPIGAGLSSSAAVEVGFAVACQSLSNWEMDRLTLAQVCQQAEVDYVGVNCGLMDQFACANGVKDHAILLDTRSLTSRPVPLPPQTVIVIADSSTRRELVTSAYNDRRRDCEAAVNFLRQRHPGIDALRDVPPSLLAQHKHDLPAPVYRHARHVVEEIVRVDQAIERLETADARGFGQLMFETHQSLRNNFEVSREELDLLVDLAAGIPGCLGARLTGAGFGGCTVNLVEARVADSFAKMLGEDYLQKTGLHASVFVTHASQGAHLATRSAD